MGSADWARIFVWSTKQKCPLNVCCSKFGFCGTTKDFCGTATVKKPSSGGSSSNQRTIGYYEGWSTTRACGQVPPEQLPAGAYSHLNFAFAFVDPSSYKIAPMSALDTTLYPRFTGLKDTNPGLQTWISVGGWSMNDPDQPTAATFSNLAASTSAQSSFFSSLLSFMSTYGFDGVDIDWEYPVAPERSGKPADFVNYVSFMANLKKALGSSGHNYGLTITLPSSYWYMQNFDIVKLEKIVDWFNVMTYDLHGTWDSTDKFIGPIVNAHTNLTEIDQTMDLFWRNNINPAKIVMGVGFYGRSFTLTNPSCSTAGCGFSSGANPGPCSANSGTLMFSEIQNVIAAGGKVTLDSKAAVKQVVWDTNQWVSYDDGDTFKMKIDFANKLGLGGLMVWAISTDDTEWTATRALTGHTGFGSSKSFSGGQSVLQADPISSCTWGECGTTLKCPSATINLQGLREFTVGASRGKNEHIAVQRVICLSARGEGRRLPAMESALIRRSMWHRTGLEEAILAGLVTKFFAVQNPRATRKWDNANGKALRLFAPLSLGSITAPEERKDVLGDTRVSVALNRHHSQDAAGKTGCSSGCPNGKQIVATDQTGCILPTQGRSKYFCCDQTTSPDTDPNATPPNFCVAPDDTYVLSGEQDDDGNPADVIELYMYENECFAIPNLADPSLKKRWDKLLVEVLDGSVEKRSSDLYQPRWNNSVPSICLVDETCYHLPNLDTETQIFLEELRNMPHARIEPRVRTPKICLPNNQKNNMRAKSYPSVSVLGATKDFYRVAKSGVKTGVCAALPLILGKRVPGVDYVVEHVTELQTPAQYANSMLAGKLPAGDAAGTAGYDWKSIFQSGGFWQKTFSSSGIKLPASLSGSTPEEAIFNTFGTSSDTSNILILDRLTNSVKASAWSLFTNIVGVNKWKAASHASRVELLLRIQQGLIGYLNTPAAQAGFKHTYDAQQAIWKAFDVAAASASSAVQQLPGGNSFVGQHRAWYEDFFLYFEGNIADFLHDKLVEEISYWASPTAVRDYGAKAAKEVLTTLKGRLTSLATDVEVQRSWLT
ncbi:hypothetical protein MMC22_010747 [Lobaria immixta]|nr:hypothetical protein [Lobaria immixta]